MVPSVNKIPEDQINNDTNFHFEMKQNVSDTESNWHFRKNVKTCLQNKAHLMPPSRHGHFHRILILFL